MDDEQNDLYWHALNYRTAGTLEAEAMWKELLACVDRLVASEREACAQVCLSMKTKYRGELDDVERGFNGALRRAHEAIRARADQQKEPT